MPLRPSPSASLEPHRSRRRPRRAAIAAAALALGPASAAAAGFDTPILYTARHQAMGGAAVGYVDDPSAAFHNPAGLQGVRGLALLGDVSLLLAKVTGSPASPASASGIQSSLIVAPVFMAAAAYRVQPWLTAGLAVFPSAAGGASYEYPVPDGDWHVNSTTVTFFELTPVVSLNVPADALLPGELSLGVGYRVSLVTFDREQGVREDPQALDLALAGTSFSGARLGLQWRASELLSLGLVYRSRVEVTTRADEGTVLGQPASDVELPFVLPAQLGGGVRTDFDRVGVAFDAMYSYQSQNRRSDLSGVLGGMPVRVPNVFEWQDGVTLRFGFEYRLGPAEQLPVRVGYVHDGQVASRRHPSAFGSPPAATRTFTMGGGYRADGWELNVALAARSGGTEVAPVELAPQSSCPTCGFAGNYAIDMTGLYVDFSTELGL